MDKRTKALQDAEAAVREIAAMNDFPPNPGDYAAIKIGWRKMVRRARRAVKKLDALTERDL